ncbi:MAG: hypothetical protein LRY66_06350 [Saccharospirillaceae bacterium]|nr:hypothetical protein [Saccharospirillaceae bacterium]MCD8530975.1 hypothetical protein [Saccharospirillaceae bacterium]
MTELHQKHHLPPIPAKEAREVKPWRLPFWTEPPAWIVEKEAADKAAKEHDGNDNNAVNVSLPTAEELENIRCEAYNAGLEQGLIEGRQQGQREGYEAGHAEGYKAAFEEGHAAGREDGFAAGEADGKRKGQADINAVVGRLERVVKQLHGSLTERDQQLPEVLAALVAGMCERVIGSQLADGAVNIHRFVQHALAELPSGEEEINVFVGPDDARHLQASLDVTGQELHYNIDGKLPAGSCRIESEHSLVEYSSADHLNQLLDSVLPQLMHRAASFPDDHEQAGWQEPESVASAAVTDTDMDSPADSAAEPVPAEYGNDAPAPDPLLTDNDGPDNEVAGDGHEPE